MRLVWFRGKWAVRHNGKRTSTGTKDRPEAERFLEDFKRDLQRKRETIGEIVNAYLEEKKNKPSIGGMRDAWKAAKPTFEHLRPDHITKLACRNYAESRKAHGISMGTVRKEIGVIRQAIKWGIPGAVPDIELPPSPAPKDRYLTREEYEKLKAACIYPHVLLFVQCAVGTGARKGAILDLVWPKVDLNRAIIDFTKGLETNKRRAIVTIDESLVEALKKAKKTSSSPYVISHSGKRVKDIKKGLEAACKRAGLHDVTAHTLRHTSAVWMAEDGIPMSEIAQVLGHTTTAVTEKVYARYSPEYLKKTTKARRV